MQFNGIVFQGHGLNNLPKKKPHCVMHLLLLHNPYCALHLSLKSTAEM